MTAWASKTFFLSETKIEYCNVIETRASWFTHDSSNGQCGNNKELTRYILYTRNSISIYITFYLSVSVSFIGEANWIFADIWYADIFK